MAIGLNRENDTPIGGLPEFRGNLQGGNVFQVGNVPVFDGEKFAPGNNDALLNGFGGLITALSVGYLADGSLIDDWDAVMPLLDVPLQVTVDAATGVLTVDQDGIYIVDFQCNVTNLANNQDYFFQLLTSAGLTGFGSHISGSNNVNSQSTGFTIQVAGTAGGQLGVVVSGGSAYDIVSASFSVTRIG